MYLMGFSQGAALSFATAMQHPGIVHGIAGLVGFMPNGNEQLIQTEPLFELPVLMLVGQRDEFIPLKLSQQSGKAVRMAGANLEYHEYDTGHKLNNDGMKKLKSWWSTLYA